PPARSTAGARRVPSRIAPIPVDGQNDADDLAETVPFSEPPDSGVPKVSHKGEWHTLH
ncbi:MAG: hypothetical protein JRI23_18810, partial [Deltaproteobacteria bacterium]|nr:hypothetical protein [Deltaproteobacteria bacterium]MBW2533915.1 hypothetical protein [Deltaproteobacteria bacterium]